MWRRHALVLSLAGGMFLSLGSLPGEVAAQDRTPAFLSPLGQPVRLDEVAVLFRRNAVPVRLYGLEGPATLAVGEEGRFTASANIDAASLPLRVRWDFGDGASASGLHAVHRYETPGTYTVSFTLSNDHGEVARSLEVTVVDAESGPG